MAPESFVVDFAILPQPGQSVEEFAEQADLRAILERCLGRLPEEHREILLLDHMGFKYREIAEILSLEVGTVRSRMSRARARMRDLLLGRAPGSADPRELFGFGGRLFKQDGPMGSGAGRKPGQEEQS
jgi:DNA-directed RNA polymerase specialized sigma24 family protein